MAEYNITGPNTAGLAQRMEKKYRKNDELFILMKNYILTCTTNQY